MKKIFYLALVAVVMVACSQSQEQKADVLIKESLNKTLYKPETYKPVDTKVDSAYAPYDNPELFEAVAELGKMNIEYEELKEKAKDAMMEMSILDKPYHQSAYDRNQYQEAKEEYDEANAKMEKLQKKGKKQYEKIAQMIQGDRKFIGYKAVHNYRADNNAGQTLIGNSIFFIDKNFEKIVFAMDVEEYNQVQEAISQFKEQMEDLKE